MIEIIGTELNQWDTGRSVRVTGTDASHVHFANQGDSKAVIMELADSQALIPDYLLQTGKQLCVYVVNDCVTVERKVFSVRKRERPEDYVYEDDQRNYIYELIRAAEDAVSNAEKATKDLLTAKENGEFNGPPGYGLGERVKKLTIKDNLNLLTGSDFFGWGGSTPANAPFNYAVMFQLHRADGSTFQKAWRVSGDPSGQFSAERVFADYKGEWDYSNPPMRLGVEYRTTERWNGEAVYTMAIKFGALPNSTSKTIESIVNADAEDIRINGVVTSGGACRPLWALIRDAHAFANHTSKGYVSIETDTDLSDWNATLILKYVVRK